jgi:hypothetical protein
MMIRADNEDMGRIEIEIYGALGFVYRAFYGFLVFLLHFGGTDVSQDPDLVVNVM